VLFHKNDSTNQSPYNFADARIHDNLFVYASVPTQFSTAVLLKLYRDPGTFRIYRNVIDATKVSPSLTNLTFGPRSMGPRNGSWGEDTPTGTLLFERPSLVNADPNRAWGLSLPQSNLESGWGTVTEFTPWVD
jgi:hypothetical protein